MPPNNKTVVENKAYNLPNDVIRIMTTKTGSVHTKNNHLWEGNLSKWKTLIVLRLKNIFPKCYDSPGLTI